MGVYSFLFSVSNVLIKGCNVADVMEDPKYSARSLNVNHKLRAAFLVCYPTTALIYNIVMCIFSWLLCGIALGLAIVILFPFVPTTEERTIFTTYTLNKYEKWIDEEVCFIDSIVTDPIILASQTWVTEYYYDSGSDLFSREFRTINNPSGGLLQQYEQMREEAYSRMTNVLHRTTSDVNLFFSNCSFACNFVDMQIINAHVNGFNDSVENLDFDRCVAWCGEANWEEDFRNGPFNNIPEDDIQYEAIFKEVVCFSNKNVKREDQVVANDRFFAFMNFFGLIRTFGAWIILGCLMPFALFSRFMNHIVARRKLKKDEQKLDSFINDPDTTIIDYVPDSDTEV